VAARLGEFCTVLDAGLVDTAPKAAAAGECFARESVDLILCYVGTYATSSQVLPAVQKARAPVLILNLQPASALNYAKTDTAAFSNVWGLLFKEWQGASARSHRLIVAGILVLIGSTFVVGFGNYIAALKR
jgi:L-arabinose isomerase